MRLGRCLRIWVAVLLLSSAAISWAEESSPIELPVSFDKVWFRPGSRGGFGGGKETGFLTVGEEGLEFAAKKSAQFWSWGQIENASYGRMRGDIDTMWVVLGVTDATGARVTVGFRDGQKLGYGQATGQIFDTVISALRLKGAGPWRVPTQFELFDDLYRQFSIAFPQGWTPHHEDVTAVEGRPIWGRSWFAPQPWDELQQQPEAQRAAIKRLERGDDPALLLDRLEAPDGMRCDGNSKKVVRRLLVAADRQISPFRWAADPRVEPIRLDGCDGWRLVGRAVNHQGDESELRLVALSDGVTLYLMQARGEIEPERFDTFVRSIRVAVAR